jgi:hypothetical protein
MCLPACMCLLRLDSEWGTGLHVPACLHVPAPSCYHPGLRVLFQHMLAQAELGCCWLLLPCVTPRRVHQKPIAKSLLLAAAGEIKEVPFRQPLHPCQLP